MPPPRDKGDSGVAVAPLDLKKGRPQDEAVSSDGGGEVVGATSGGHRRVQSHGFSVAHLSSLRGFSLEQLDEMLDRRPPTSAPVSPRLATTSAPVSPRNAENEVGPSSSSHPPKQPAVTALAHATAQPGADAKAEVEAMRRALTRVEKEAARGIRLDPTKALAMELDSLGKGGPAPTKSAAPAKPAPTPVAETRAEPTAKPAALPSAAKPSPFLPTPASAPADRPPLQHAASAPGVAPTTEPEQEGALRPQPQPQPQPQRTTSARTRSFRGWIPRAPFTGRSGPSKAETGSVDLESDMAEENLPLASRDGAAPEDGEDADWALALRYSAGGGRDLATVHAALQAADQIEPTSDGAPRRAVSLAPSWGDARALAAAARKAVALSGRGAPDASGGDAGGNANARTHRSRPTHMRSAST
jgi:hypothetical protein